MITDIQTNKVYFSSLLPTQCPILNKSITETLRSHGVSFDYLSGTKDVWCRDFMPIQIGTDHILSYQYTPDYLQDKTGLRLQTNIEDVFLANSNHLEHLQERTVAINLVIDGGNIVKCGDIVVMTEKVFVENKDKSPAEVEGLLKEAFQCEFVFLPWDLSEKYGHSDGIVHYAGGRKIIMTNYEDFSPYYANRYKKILGSHFEIIPLNYSTKRKHARSWAYINFLQVGKLILIPQLGLEEDEQALEQISKVLPNCEVVGIPSLEPVRRGGALNCISWNIKV